MMTKQKLKSTEYLVKRILEEFGETRNNDNLLYLKVCQIISFDKGHWLSDYNVIYFLLHMKELGFPPFETVRRSRQKLQREFPELRASKKVADQREENEKIYRNFVKEEVI